jgi:hypothetical protein
MKPRLTCVTLAFCLAAGLGAAAPAAHLKVSREHSFTVALPASDAFPLFEPIGEKKWAEGWNPVFPSAGDLPLRDGSVFTVEAPRPDGRGVMQSVWSVSLYAPPRLIEYRNVVLGLRATRISVECVADGEKRTKVTVRYEYTGLSAEGDALIGQITPGHYAAMIDQWGEAIAAYLKRGTPATP